MAQSLVVAPNGSTSTQQADGSSTLAAPGYTPPPAYVPNAPAGSTLVAKGVDPASLPPGATGPNVATAVSTQPQGRYVVDATTGLESYVPNSAPTPSSSPTIRAFYGSENTADQRLDSATEGYRTAAAAPVDEAGIRSNVMSNLQAEIDATNSVYAQKLKEAQIAGEGRLGSTAAINARRGLLGSDFGAANNDTTTNSNNDIYSGIGAEKAAAIGAITDKGNTEATNEIAAKNAVKQSSATDYINFLSQQRTRQTTRTGNAASAIVSSGVDTSTLTPDDIAGIAKSYNVTPEALTAAITSAKATVAAAQKSNLVTAPITDSVLQPDGKGGFKTVQQGSATPDSALKEYQYAVQKDGYTGSLADWNADKANQKVSVGVNSTTGSTFERAGPGVAGTGSSGSASSGNGVPSSSGNSSAPPATDAKTQYGAGQAVTALPQGVPSISSVVDGGALALFNGTEAPSEAKTRGALGQNMLNQANAISLALTGKPYDPNATDAAYTFRKSTQYNNYTAAAPSALRNIQAISQDANSLGLSNITDLNDWRVGLMARGLWPGATPAQTSAAKDIQSRLAQSQDDIGLLLGTGTGSDTKLALGGLIYNPKGSPKTNADLTAAVTATIANKLGDYYKKAGVTDPSVYLQQDTQKLLGGTNTAVASTVAGSNLPKGSMSDSDYVAKVLNTQGLNYSNVMSQFPAGQKGVIDNATGQIGSIPPSEFDPSLYTPL